MSTAAKSAAKKKFWKVTLKGHPIQGLTDKNGVVHFSRPRVLHYHPPHNARYTIASDRQVPPEWYTEEDLKGYGLTPEEVVEQGWMSQLRPDANVRSDNFLSAYIEADSASQAKGRYRKLLKIRNAPTSGFVAERAPDDVTYAHPVDIAKKRKRHKVQEDDPWADVD